MILLKKSKIQVQKFRILVADSQQSSLKIDIILSKYDIYLKEYSYDGVRSWHLFGKPYHQFDFPFYETRKQAIQYVRKFMADNNLLLI